MTRSAEAKLAWTRRALLAVYKYARSRATMKAALKQIIYATARRRG